MPSTDQRSTLLNTRNPENLAMHMKQSGRPVLPAFAFGLFGLIALAAWIFAPALDGPFILDDGPNLETLRHLNSGVSGETLGQYLVSAHGNPGRPLAMLSFLIEDASWPTEPRPYKRTNLLLHLLAGMLVVWLTLRLSLLTAVRAQAPWIALGCGAAFLLNPLQLSSTMQVVQRMNILSGLLVLAGLIAYLHCLTSLRHTPGARVGLALTALTLSAFLAVLCKENGVLVFAYAAVLNLTLLANRVDQYPSAPRAMLWAGTTAPLALLVAGAGWNWARIQADYQARDFTMIERLLTQPRVLLDYLSNIFVPRIAGQGLFHDDFIASTGLLAPVTTLISALLVLCALVAAVAVRRRAPLFAFAVLWFLAGHAIESSVIALELYFEHRNYLPMIGPLFAVMAWALSRPSPHARLAAAVLAVWLVLAGAMTHMSARTWGDREQQSMVWLQENPRSARAAQWAAAYQLENGRADVAMQILHHALANATRASDVSLQVIQLECLTEGLDTPRKQQLDQLLRSSPFSNLTPMLFGWLVDQAWAGGCRGTLGPGNVVELADAVLANPAFEPMPTARAQVHHHLARHFRNAGDLEAVLEQLGRAHQLHPFPTYAREQAMEALMAGQPDRALHYIEQSNQTRLPFPKRLLLDVEASNAPLVADALQMKQDMQAEGNTEPLHP
jgi:protein O-mannosyl-transferase